MVSHYPNTSSLGQKLQTRVKKQSLTLVAVPDGVEVHVVLVVGEEEEAEPGVKGIDGDDEEDPHDVALLPG